MDFFIDIAVHLQILLCTVLFAACGEYIFALPIIGYALLFGMFEYTKSFMMCMDEIAFEKTEQDILKRPVIPIVHNRSVWLFCKALNIKAKLVNTLDSEKENVAQSPVPSVRNPKVWSLCKELGMKVKLELPKNYEMTKPTNIPTVYNKDVYLLCRALKIKAQMHS